ncbi:MAG TPA: cell division protein FtsQ/DivIB [Gallionella sp.]|nr:cell division protein FtsQ/DivIB [Gallionella sp.]
MWDNAILLRNIANTLMVFSVLAVLYGAVYYTVHLPGLFPVHSVRLSTAPHRVVAAEVLAVVRSEMWGNFFTVDIGRLRQSLEKLPWVRSVNIRREFPDRLMVQLEEHQALARWNNSALVNMQGEVFSAGSEQVLPSFIGQPGDSNEVAQRYMQFSRQLAALNLQVAQIALSPRHAWQLRLNNGMVLELGREEMQQRLARFVTVYPYSLAGQAGSVRYVDMRYRNGFAVGGIVKS